MAAFSALMILFAVPVFENLTEWAVLFAVIGITLAAETFNSSVERLCDRVCKTPDKDIKFVKDTAAGAVLLVSVFDCAAGVCLFVLNGRLPKIIRFCLSHFAYSAAVILILILIILSVILRGKQND